MRAVDQRIDAARRYLRYQARHRIDQCGRTGDVVDQEEARAAGHAFQYTGHDLIRRSDGEGDVGTDDLCPRQSGDVIEHVARGVVLMRGDEQLVVLVEIDRAEDGVHAGGGVGDEGQFRFLRTE